MPTRPHLVDNESRSAFRVGFWAPTRGVRLPADQTDLRDRCASVIAACGTAVTFSGLTALELWGGVDSDPECVEFTIPADAHHVRRRRHRCRRRALAHEDIGTLHGLPLTSPARTFVDLADRMSLPRLVAVGDDLLARGLMDAGALWGVIERSDGQRGVCLARHAAAMLDARSESPRESMVRALLVEGGFGPPELQWEVRDSLGHFVARLDLAYVEARIAIEYDGDHHLSRERQAKDAARRLDLAEEGWLVITVVADDIRHPGRLYAKVRRALNMRRTFLQRPQASAQ